MVHAAATAVHTTGINWDSIGVIGGLIFSVFVWIAAQLRRGRKDITDRFDEIDEKLDQHGNRLTAIESRSRWRREEDYQEDNFWERRPPPSSPRRESE
jgi:hypothetical protein